MPGHCQIIALKRIAPYRAHSTRRAASETATRTSRWNFAAPSEVCTIKIKLRLHWQSTVIALPLCGCVCASIWHSYRHWVLKLAAWGFNSLTDALLMLIVASVCVCVCELHIYLVQSQQWAVAGMCMRKSSLVPFWIAAERVLLCLRGDRAFGTSSCACSDRILYLGAAHQTCWNLRPRSGAHWSAALWRSALQACLKDTMRTHGISDQIIIK